VAIARQPTGSALKFAQHHPIQVKNLLTGKVFTIDVDPADTIDSVKTKVESAMEDMCDDDHIVAADNQCLMQDGKELDDDTKTVKECGILESGSKLEVLPIKIPIKVKTPGGKSSTYGTCKDAPLASVSHSRVAVFLRYQRPSSQIGRVAQEHDSRN
jgi:hypothetical protein